MRGQIVYETQPRFLNFVADRTGRGVPYGPEARAIGYVNPRTDEIICALAFMNWTTWKTCEVSVASNGSKDIVDRAFINGVYQCVFEFWGMNRLNMTVNKANADALAVHRVLGHPVEAETLKEYYGPQKDGTLFRFTKQDYLDSRWYAWRVKEEKKKRDAHEQGIQGMEG